MRIATLSIGDELISGQVTDTNAGTIAAELLDKGLRVKRHLTVGDCELDIIEALADLGRHSDVIIVSGGLGPTADDVTTHAVARATGRRLVVNDEAREHVQRMTARIGIGSVLTSSAVDKQMMLPTKTSIIPNPNGTACGFYLMHNGCSMFFMPGVPAEMCPMLCNSVIPFLQERAGRKRYIATATFNVFGPREAEVDALLSGIARPEQGLQLGICVSFPAMRVTVRAEADSLMEAEALLVSASVRVRGQLGIYIYAEGSTTLAERVASLFAAQGGTLSLAESCTGGMISQAVTAVPGSSAFFLEGAVTYSNTAKIRRLGVPVTLLNEKGAVSHEVAAAMAKGMRASSGSDVALAVTGIAGPDGGSAEKPVGTVYIALADRGGCQVKRCCFGGTREQVRIMTMWMALDWLRRYLEGSAFIK